MTDRERQLIEGYIPSPADPELEVGEYYCQDLNGRVQKVRITNLYPYDDSGTMICGCVYANSGRHFTGECGTPPYDGVPMGFLYDNKEDCKNRTHSWYERWEHLRKIQKEG